MSPTIALFVGDALFARVLRPRFDTMNVRTSTECAYILMTNVDPVEWRGKISSTPRIIGRDALSQIRIPDKFSYVSRVHAKVWADHKGFWIHDLGSSSSTALNGILLEPHKDYRLAIGDRIWLGGVELEVVSPDVADDPELRRQNQLRKALADTDQIDVSARTKEMPYHLALKQLTHAELEILLWMRRGLVMLDDLAAKLHRSPHTVRTQMASIFRKMGVHSRHELFSKFDRKSGESTTAMSQN